MATDDPLRPLAAAIAPRFDAAKWMKRNYRRLVELFSRTDDVPNWEALRGPLAELGVRTRDGRPYAASSLRMAWWKVRNDAARTSRPTIVVKPVPTVTIAAQSYVENNDPLAALRREIEQRSGR